MLVLSARTLLLILLFMIRASTGSVISSTPYSTVERKIVGTIQQSNNVHNATAHCGDPLLVPKIAFQCQRGLYNLEEYGYPWSPDSSHRRTNVTDRNTIRDALDSLNNVCRVQERSQICLKESGIGDFCLATTGFQNVQIDFQFICQHQRRDENLVHSLQCLHDTRVLQCYTFI